MEDGGDPQLPSISVARTTSEGAGAVNLDDLLEQLLYDDNGSSNSVSFSPPSAFFSVDATATTVTTAVLEMNELNYFTPHGKGKVEELSFGGNSADRRGEASWTSLAGTSHQESELAALQMHGMFSPGGQGPSPSGVHATADGSKAKRPKKAEKTVSLQVLRQYDFAGSLKNAERSLGVMLAPATEPEGMVGDGAADGSEQANASASTTGIPDNNIRKNRSKERDYFHITPAMNGQPARATCIDCGTQVGFSHGTSVLRKHRKSASCKKKRAVIEEAPNCPRERVTCIRMEEGGDPQLPSISVSRTTSEGVGAVDLDLLEQLLSGDNSWLEVVSADVAATTVTTATATATAAPAANAGWWIQTGGASPSSVRDRFSQALSYIQDTQSDGDVLVQLWVPVNRDDGKLVLTTSGQPFTLDHRSDSLRRFRDVSTKYQFSADIKSGDTPGLPGRVFIGRLPEWSPDIRYFTSYEYPRVRDAQYLDVHGTMGLPVFEKGSYNCLGVIELIMTRQKLNFTSELNTICSALQAVNFRSTEVSTIPRIKFSTTSYKDALPEILEVLRAACLTHKLPLAQTWVPCAQQGKRGSRHSDENYRYCISTIDEACFVNEAEMQGFHEACSEHHLLRGEGVAGKAFTTNQPCFLPDIGSSTKLEYPLSHHAKIFKLKGAVAIRLRCTRTGTADFVLEFFLPTDCEALEDQKTLLDSLSGTMRSVCQTLRVVTDREMEDEAVLEMKELNSLTPHGKDKVEELSFGGNSAERRGEASRISLAGTSHQESELAALRMHGMFSPGEQGPSLSGVQATAEGSKAKRRTKAEKTVSLQVLRQYFAGSLKDAARSLGVCPTTLKRICRQHGINRWPSRKIKKVDHSLRKLQQIIDSVHGAETAFQLNTLYKDLTNTSVSSDNNLSGSVTVPPTNQSNLTNFNKNQPHKSSTNVPSTSHSHSSCSHSSESSPSCSGGATKHAQEGIIDLMKSENPVKKSSIQTLQTENTSLYEHFSVHEDPINLLQDVTAKGNGGHHSSRSPLSPNPKQNTDANMRVKATFGSEKVRFRLNPECNFQELKHEIAKRLGIVDTNPLVLKYLDDDSEWVLMTCDTDLQECLHVYKLGDIQTIKISVHLAVSPATRVTTGHTGLS